MAARLRIFSDELDDNWIRVTINIPARRNGELNLGMLTAINAALLPMRPDAFDPDPKPLSAPEIAHEEGHTSDGGGIVLDIDLKPEVRAAMLRAECSTGNCDD